MGFKKTKLQILPLEKRLMLDASLPAIAGQVLWLDGADASTIIDADGDNAADGTGGNNDGFSGSVATWQDKSASGSDVTAAGSAQPQYGVDTQNGEGVLTFDGSDDRLVSGDVIAGDDVTMFIVYNRTASTSRDAVFELGGGGSRNGLFLFANNTVQHYSNGQFRAASGTYALGDYHLASYIHDGANIDGWMNGDSVLSTTTSPRASTTSIVVGDDVTSGDEMTGTVAEIIVYDRDLTADERHDVETYLAGKWGLTITNADPTLDTNAGLTLDEGTTLGLTNTELVSSDTDNSDGNLTYTITDAVDNGTLTNTNTASNLILGDTFTQSDIDNGYITYTHDGSATTADAFIFDLSDGFGNVTAQTFSITINAVGTLTDLNAIPDPVFHYDAQDIDADGDFSDQPADGATVNQIINPIGTTDTASQGSSGSRPLYNENAFGYGIGGLVYDGSNDHTIIPNDNLVNTGSYAEKSFAMTFRTGTDISGTQMIYEQGGGSNGYNVVIVDGDLYAYAWAESYWSGADRFKAINLGPVSAETTYTVVMVHDATGATLDDRTFSANVNGGAFTTLTRADVMGGHSGDAVLGRSTNSQTPVGNANLGAGSYFEGAIGEIWAWNHALDAGEIADIQDYFNDRWYDPAPVITSATLDVPEDGIISITDANLDVNDNAPDNVLTYTLTAMPAEGTLYLSGVALNMSDTFTQDDINNGLVTFDHDGTAAPGADSFNYSLYDGFSSPVTGTFNFNITAAAATDPVLIQNDLITLDEGATATITVAELDTNDGDTADTGLTYTITNDVDNGTLFNNGVALGLNDTFTQQNIVDGLITYTHNDSEVFSDNFQFTVSDGATTLPVTSFSFAINPVNDQTPTDIAISSANVNENSSNGTVIGTFSATDADLPGDTLTYSIVNDPDNKFQIVGDQLRVNGGLNHENQGSHSVTVRVNDGVQTYDEVFTITVNDVNENPTDIAIDNLSVDENSATGALIGNLSATDPDQPGDTFTYTIVSDPDGVFQITGSRLEVGANMDFESSASHNVTIRVSDGNGGTRNEAYVITVTDVNDVPIINFGDAAVVAQGSEVTLTTAMLTATDVDNVDAGLVYEITGLPSNGDVKLNGVILGINDTFTQQDLIDGNVTYDHDNAVVGDTDSFDFTVTDGGLTTGVETMNIQVNPALVNMNDVTLAEGSTGLVDNTDLNFSGQDATWYDSNWSFRQQITIDSALIGSDLTDFAVLITENGFNADFWNNVKADGSDIVITMGDGTTALDRELVSIDTIGETLQLYARTDLSSTVDTELYIYYGNAAAAETNAATTWRNEYTGVWHFDDDFNDGNAADSSQTGHDGIAGGGFDNTNQAAGVTGQGVEFNNSEYLALNYSYQGNNTLPEISVSAWVNTTVNGGSQSGNWAIIDFDRSDFFNVYIHENGQLGFSTTANGSGTDDFYSGGGVTVNDGNWHHVAAVYDGTDKVLYVDGVEVLRDANSHGGRDLGTNNTRFGFIGDGSEASSFNASRNNFYYDGLYDDIRMYEGTLDAAWIAAEYANHNAPNTFYSTNAQEIENGEVNFTLTDIPDHGVLFIDNVIANGTLDAGEELTVNDTFSQTDIDNNLLYYLHDAGETTSDSFSFTAADLLANVTASQTFDFIITPVNDVPTDIILDNDHIAENASVGSVVGLLDTADVDLPGDTFTYTILNDPDGKFVINGNQLELAASLDYELITSHSVTLRTNDGAGGTFDRIFTIEVDNVADDAVIPPDGGNQGTPNAPPPPQDRIGDAENLRTLQRLEDSDTLDGVLKAALSGDAGQISAFYSPGELLQILRNHTTLQIRELGEQIDGENLTPENADNAPEQQDSAQSPEQRIQDRFTNLREALAFFEQIEDTQTHGDGENAEENAEDETDDSGLPSTSLDQQFQDVLTYQQRRQAELREALLSA